MVLGNGSDVEVARTLAKQVKKVYYFCEWRQTGFPDEILMTVGANFPEFEKILNTDDYEEETDLFVFTDNLYGAMQERLRRAGKKVYGTGYASELEEDRIGLKKILKKQGLPISPYAVLTGTEELSEYLKKHDNQYIKINIIRGRTETWHAESYKIVEPKITDLSQSMIMKYQYKYLSEDELPHMPEEGIDTYYVGGKHPKVVMAGIEMPKDVAYQCRMIEYNKLPKELTIVNDKLEEVFDYYDLKGPVSTEVRISDKHESFLGDLTMRFGNPPAFTQLLAWTNLAEIFWGVANGEIVEPEYDFEYFVEVEMNSDWGANEDMVIYIPDDVRENVKLKYCTIINKELVCLPQVWKIPQVGSIVAGGKTLEEARKKVAEIAKKIKGLELKIPIDDLMKSEDEIKQMTEMKINFFD
jgi:phosphoribosylamine-glycine ligase